MNSNIIPNNLNIIKYFYQNPPEFCKIFKIKSYEILSNIFSIKTLQNLTKSLYQNHPEPNIHLNILYILKF